jgi:hypothetical protein
MRFELRFNCLPYQHSFSLVRRSRLYLPPSVTTARTISTSSLFESCRAKCGPPAITSAPRPNIAHTASAPGLLFRLPPPEPGTDFNVVMIGAGVSLFFILVQPV